MSILLSEGAYGCVYYPGIQCSGKSSNDKDSVSKLQINNFNAQNEIKIGKMVSEIENYDRYFIPITSGCALDLSLLDKSLKKECNVIKKTTKTNFIVMNMKFIENIAETAVLSAANSLWLKKKKISQMFDMFGELTYSVHQLLRHNIVHFDLKQQNIVVDDKSERTFIIDFGISLPMKEVRKNMKNYFYSFTPSYYIWPLEVHVLNYLSNIKKTALVEDDAILIATQYSSAAFIDFFSPIFAERFKIACLTQVKKYVGIPPETLVSKLLKYHTTWDNYAISIMFIEMLNKSFNKGHHYNKMFILFSQILLVNCAPNPELRLSYHDTHRLFKNIFYTNDDITSFHDLCLDIS